MCQIPLPSGSVVDASHSGAMFGNVNAPALVVSTSSRNGTSDAASAPDDDPLMHSNVSWYKYRVCNAFTHLLLLSWTVS